MNGACGWVGIRCHTLWKALLLLYEWMRLADVIALNFNAVLPSYHLLKHCCKSELSLQRGLVTFKSAVSDKALPSHHS